MDSAANQHSYVENLVASSAVIKCTRLTPFRHSQDVVASPCDINCATNSEPLGIDWHLVHCWVEIKQAEKGDSRKPCQHEHNASNRSILGLIELLDKCDHHTGQVKGQGYKKACPLGEAGSVAGEPVDHNWY